MLSLIWSETRSEYGRRQGRYPAIQPSRLYLSRLTMLRAAELIRRKTEHLQLSAPWHPSHVLTPSRKLEYFRWAPITGHQPRITVLLQPEPLVHHALQPGLVEDVKREFFPGKHGQSGAPRTRSHFGSFFHRQVRILADHRHHHADHHLQPANPARFIHLLTRKYPRWFGSLRYCHAAPLNRPRRTPFLG